MAEKTKTLDILGISYEVVWSDYNDEPYFKDHECDGFCDDLAHRIVICNAKSHPVYSEETDEYCKKAERLVLRHEIIHAFLSESGLSDSSGVIGIGWAKNEEMVDWIAIQFPKILRIYREADCI